MPSIKFTASELEFLVGQYEQELIEAEKYIAEIKNILKKFGVVSKDIPGKKEIIKKRGRGRPSKISVSETKLPSNEKQSETPKKKKGKPGRPRKRGPKKGTKRKAAYLPKPIEEKVTAAKAAVVIPAQKPAAKKVVKKAKPAKKSALKQTKTAVKPAQRKVATIKAKSALVKESAEKNPIQPAKVKQKKEARAVPVKAEVRTPAKKKKVVKKKSVPKAKPAPKPKAAPKVEVPLAVIETPPAVTTEEKPAEA